MALTHLEQLSVRCSAGTGVPIEVGTLALVDRRLYFEYAQDWLARGIELSPFHLPLQPGLIAHEPRSFGPLFGLFDDSLPDGWGMLLMDRFFRKQGIDPASLNVLDRLAYLGERGMGALSYHPPQNEACGEPTNIDLSQLAAEAKKVLSGSTAEVLPELFRAGGSPGGARPKVLVGYNPLADTLQSDEGDLPEEFEAWMVKFPSAGDGEDAGRLEFAYGLMAKAAGLDLPEMRLFEVESGGPFFGVKRFDRGADNQHIHMHTFAGLLHADFRIPCCDYEDLLKAGYQLTRDRRSLLTAFRQAAFNVAAHNRDDHAKNFSFLLDVESVQWRLAPSYDLTYSSGPGGEHTTTVCGEGLKPGRDHLMELAHRLDLDDQDAHSALDQVADAVAHWSSHARKAGVSKARMERIAGQIGLPA